MSARRQRGFTLIELLIVVAIIGLLAAIGIWNYIIALERAKQKKTIADMRTIAAAWETRAADVSGYNVAGFTWPTQSVTYTDLSQSLTPTYVRAFPKEDGWGRAFEFATNPTTAADPRGSVHAIRSAGRDGVFEATYVEGGTTNFDCDIVYANSGFIVFPEGQNK